jgi:HAD superfamily hydrolase (TIGR01509 family)
VPLSVVSALPGCGRSKRRGQFRLHEAIAIAIDAIFWDNDGILVDTEHLYFEATRDTLRTVGIPLTEAEYIQLFLIEGRGAWHLAAERGASPAEVERLRDQRNALYDRWLSERAEAMPGIEGVLQALHGRFTMGVVTSSRKDHFDTMHARTGLMQYFDFVLTASDYPRVKPWPDPYLTAIGRTGLPPERCIAVEDSARGLQAALAASLRCIVVPTGLNRQSDFTGAYRVLDRIEELPDMLLPHFY